MNKLGDIVTFDFTTHNPLTGSVSDADALPTCEVFEDDNDTAILEPVVSKRTGKTGNYRVSIEASIANGFEVGKSYNVIVSTTVAVVSAKARIGVFVLDTKRNADMNDLSQAQILSDATPFPGASIDASILSRASQLTVNDIKTETDKIQPEIIDKKNEYKADVSTLALETTAQLIENRTSNLPDDPTSETNALSNKADVIAEVDANEVKIDDVKTEEDLIKGLLENGSYGLDALKTLIETMDTSTELQARFDEIKGTGWTIETLKAIKDTIDSLDLELDGVAKEITLNTKASQASVDAVKIDTASIVSTLSTLVADMWAYTTRTLTSFGTLVADIWGNLTRTLTVGTKDAEIDEIKTKTDQLTFTVAGRVDATASGAGGGLTPEEHDNVMMIEGVSDKVLDIYALQTEVYSDVKRVLGLIHENVFIDLPIYDLNNNLISARIRIYDDAVNVGTTNGVVGTYMVTADSDGPGKFTYWRQVKE